jgi:hypothetical protein
MQSATMMPIITSVDVLISLSSGNRTVSRDADGPRVADLRNFRSMAEERQSETSGAGAIQVLNPGPKNRDPDATGAQRGPSGRYAGSALQSAPHI